jgi:hypothetical protein
MMENRKRKNLWAALAAGMLIVLACTCGPLGALSEAQKTLAPALTEVEQQMPTFEAMATQSVMTLTATGPDLETLNAMVPTLQAGITEVAGQGEQWAVSAAASSQYGDTSWSAMQATGAPNTAVCADQVTAWASQSPGTVETLQLVYAMPVIPQRIDIYQTYHPGTVVRVEVIDEAGVSYVVYEGQAIPIDQCPFVMSVKVSGVQARVRTVIITIDQSTVNDWSEIDAVMLVGQP